MRRHLGRLGLLGTMSVLGCAVASEAGPLSEDEELDPPDASTGVTFVGSPDAAVPTFDARPPDAAVCMGGQAWTENAATGACYMLFTTNVAWYDAKAACETMTPSAHLVTVTDANEAGMVAGLASSGEPWIGLNDVRLEGTYGWVTSEPFAFTDWNSGEPNDTGDCVRLQGGRWADLQCGNGRPYICER